MSKTKAAGPGHYEVLFIIANKYTEEEAKDISQEIENIISKHEGGITYKEFWGKKKLAYPIMHNHFGYYSLLEFDLEARKLPALNDNLRLFDKLIRHQIIKIEKRSAEEIAKQKAKQEELSKASKEEPKESSKKDEKDEKKKEKKESLEKVKTEEVKEEKNEEKKEEKKDNLDELDSKLDNILDAQDLIK